MVSISVVPVMLSSHDAPMEIRCTECGDPFPGSQTSCPHCGRPSLFPNVTAASHANEVAALDLRYEQACTAAAKRGCSDVRERLEAEIDGNARVVISTNFNELQRL